MEGFYEKLTKLQVSMNNFDGLVQVFATQCEGELTVQVHLGRQKVTQGCSHLGGQGGHGPLTSNSEQNKVQQFPFQTSGILLLTSVQKLYGQKISRFLPCMLHFLDDSWCLFIFSNYIWEIDHFTLDLFRRFDT